MYIIHVDFDFFKFHMITLLLCEIYGMWHFLWDLYPFLYNNAITMQ